MTRSTPQSCMHFASLLTLTPSPCCVRYYTPTIIVLAILSASIPWAWGTVVGEEWLKRSLVLLVVACPCALVISTPITYVCGLAHGARCGIRKW